MGPSFCSKTLSQKNKEHYGSVSCKLAGLELREREAICGPCWQGCATVICYHNRLFGSNPRHEVAYVARADISGYSWKMGAEVRETWQDGGWR